MLRLPHLVDGTEHTTQEFTRHIVWSKDDFGRGLQMMARPPIANFGSEEVDFGDELIGYQKSMSTCEEWSDFREAQLQLGKEDLEKLREASNDLRNLLRPEVVDAFEPTLALRRSAYRSQQLTHHVQGLSGAAARYANAFRLLDALIEESLGHVLGQLVGYGPPREMRSIAKLDFIDPRTITFHLSEPFFDTGVLVLISDPLVAEVGIVTKVSFATEGGESTLQLEVSLLAGAREAWGL